MPESETVSLLANENIRTAVLILLFMVAIGTAALLGRGLMKWSRHQHRRRHYRRRPAAEIPAPLHE